ncbi:hypothetical protein Acy02nite_91860 [Actinoplanes cyaneus]|uniref:Uncharacterized protein n=1 Tax=Actinoplanes cyaneus TaxID=52696 RepID=A0A919J057_9ACTN|nr:hypothetical protein [Actinoplanes cyaneus]GID71305.1 hypothetical protein Acy02nite_91860 [Actinoplanes cyaneus]
MSWSLHIVPLHELANDGMLEWAMSAQFSRGIPASAPLPLPLPSAADVLAAFRGAGCHGSAWFKIHGDDPRLRLPECRDPDSCYRVGGRDLGEVDLATVGQVDSEQPITGDAAVAGVSFRKPIGVAVLAAVCELAALAGSQLVFDDSADRVFVVRPGEQPADLVGQWPW